MSNLLFFDIETVQDESRAHLWENKKQEVEGAGKEFIPALNPEFCCIVALGWALNDKEPDYLVVGTERENKTNGEMLEINEHILLQHFWQLIKKDSPQLVGFNILNFDLPVIFVRSAILNVKPSRHIDRKPWGTDCIDLLQTRRYTNGGGKLKELASYFGFEIPEAELDGSMVEDLWETDPSKLAKYVKSDVAITRQLYHFYHGYFF